MTPQHLLAGVYAAAVTSLLGKNGDSSPDLESVPALLHFRRRARLPWRCALRDDRRGPSFSFASGARCLRGRLSQPQRPAGPAAHCRNRHAQPV